MAQYKKELEYKQEILRLEEEHKALENEKEKLLKMEENPNSFRKEKRTQKIEYFKGQIA